MIEKKCTKCGETKPLDGFNRDKKSRKDGRRNDCRSCSSARYKAWVSENKDKRAEYMRGFRAENRDHLIQWRKGRSEQDRALWEAYYERNKPVLCAANAKWARDNRDRCRKNEQIRRATNPGQHTAKVSRRNAAKLQRTPAWFEKEAIDFVYAKREELSEAWGITLHVDHIIPLQGKNVSGLHCHANLQLLEASMNTSKSNKYAE